MQSLLVHTFQLSQTFVLFPVRLKQYYQISHTKEIASILIYETPWGPISIKFTGGYSNFSFKQTQGQRLQTRMDAMASPSIKPGLPWLTWGSGF